MPSPLKSKITLSHLRDARSTGDKVAMLTCYDYTTARLMQEAGVPALLVGDSAANVILGHETTLPVRLEFLMELTAAVRRGAPNAFLVADMPFGSYHGGIARGVRNVLRVMKSTGCDCVKIEVTAAHLKLVRRLAGADVPVMAHLGLRPQAVAMLGGYKYQGRTADSAEQIVGLAKQMELAGAAALLLEAVPAEVTKVVVDSTAIPVIGCGAGPDCHGHVIVTHDGLGLTERRPRFVPTLADLAGPMQQAFAKYVNDINRGAYPAPEHLYPMPLEEKQNFIKNRNAHADSLDILYEPEISKPDE